MNLGASQNLRAARPLLCCELVGKLLNLVGKLSSHALSTAQACTERRMAKTTLKRLSSCKFVGACAGQQGISAQKKPTVNAKHDSEARLLSSVVLMSAPAVLPNCRPFEGARAFLIDQATGRGEGGIPGVSGAGPQPNL